MQGIIEHLLPCRRITWNSMHLTMVEYCYKLSISWVLLINLVPDVICCKSTMAPVGSPTVAKSHSYTSGEILFEITEITRFSRSEIKKIGTVACIILWISIFSHVTDNTYSFWRLVNISLSPSLHRLRRKVLNI